MNVFRHQSVPRIFFGSGCLLELSALLPQLKAEQGLPECFTALAVCGRHAQGQLERLKDLCAQAKVKLEVFLLPPGEPTLTAVEAGIEAALGSSLVFGFGGGSALDAAKAIAGLSRLPGKPEDYFYGQKVDKPALPWIGIPTTAGSGAEVTNNAVLIHRGKKQSVRSPFWFAKAAVVDPELTLSLPPRQTALSGLDALTHAVEAYTSRFADPLSDLLSQRAVESIRGSLSAAVEAGRNLQAREGLLLGSLLAAMAFVNCRLGAVHGLAHSIGVRCGAPHGLVCAVLLPHVYLYNLSALGAKARQLGRIWRVPSPELVAAEVWDLMAEFGLPASLSALGLKRETLAAVAQESLSSASMAANPKSVDLQSLESLLEKAY